MQKKSLCTVVTDFCKYIKADDSYIDVFEKIQSSSMGIYKHLGQTGEFIHFKELITNKEIKTICPSGYNGKQGEVWLVRILPPISDHFDYSVVFTTPYVLESVDQNNSDVEQNWLDFFKRNNTNKDSVDSYLKIMKTGLNAQYWNEYIFNAYKKSEANVVFLAGVPDIQSSISM